MLDITQLDCSLSARPLGAHGTQPAGQGAVSTAEKSVRHALLSAKPAAARRITRLCVQNCLNCLSDSRPRRSGAELSTEEGKALTRDLAAIGVPRLVFAGGEPLMRPDLPESVAYTHQLGVQPSPLRLLNGRCGNCRWKTTCGGNLRVRAEQYYGDPWTFDPACYLTNKEIGKPVSEEIAAMEDDVLLSEMAA